MWGIIFIVFVILFFISIVYLTSRIHKFSFINKVNKSWKSWIYSLIILIILCVTIDVLIGLTSLILVLIHLSIFMLVCDFLFFIFKKNKNKKYYAGAIALIITIVYFSFGWYYAHVVFKTTYNVDSSKNIKSLKILQITDSHVCSTFDGDGFIQYSKRINNEVSNVDIITITGDFVDDGTTKKDMIKSCKAIKNLNSKYGKYFIYGNHDRGYYDDKNFTEKELITNLKKAGVTILEDKSILVNNKFYIVGRADYSTRPNRKSMHELMKNIDTSKYIIVLDHEPTDYDDESKENIDLVLSGHTHGGQMIPMGFISEKIMKVNDRTYGIEKKNNTNFIVSSGISDWEIPFKTGTSSEYVVINVN